MKNGEDVVVYFKRLLQYLPLLGWFWDYMIYVPAVSVHYTAPRWWICVIQGDARGQVSVLGRDCIGNCGKTFHTSTCLILNGYRGTAVWIWRPKCVRFLFVGLSEEWSLRKKGGYATRIARSQFGCCSQHKEREDQLRRTKRDIRTRVVRWGWRWDFRTFAVNCDQFVI